VILKLKEISNMDHKEEVLTTKDSLLLNVKLLVKNTNTSLFKMEMLAHVVTLTDNHLKITLNFHITSVIQRVLH
jgi:hypothetical protein